MGIIFLRLVHMSFTASWLILAVIILRLLLKKAPKWIICALWSLVAIRLLCPYTLESAFSLIPSSETIRMKEADTSYSVTLGEIPSANQGMNNALTNQQNLNTGEGSLTSMNPEGITEVMGGSKEMLYANAAAAVWLLGMAVLSGYEIVSFIGVKRRMKEAVPVKENIWLCDTVNSPFILGVMRPRIYLSSSMREDQMEAVISHEHAHLQRLDHIWKPLGYLLLSIYWFNPLSWLAYHLLGKDIELASDEKVIKALKPEEKQAYCETLLACSMQKKLVFACPLAFSEVGVKERIKNVLNYKKPSFWIVLAAIAGCVIVAACFLTDPKSPSAEPTAGAEEGTAVGAEEGTEVEAGENKIKKAVITEEIYPGADGASLDFLDDSIVIFHDYYGLFIYDYRSQNMITSLDLESIGCDATQGDDYCEVAVSRSGDSVYLHVISSAEMYQLDYLDNRLVKKEYHLDENSLFQQFVTVRDYEEIADATVFRSKRGTIVTGTDGKEYLAFLESGSGMPMDMAVVMYEHFADGSCSTTPAESIPVFHEDSAQTEEGQQPSLHEVMNRILEKVPLADAIPIAEFDNTSGDQLYLLDQTADGVYRLYGFHSETYGYCGVLLNMVTDTANHMRYLDKAEGFYWFGYEYPKLSELSENELLLTYCWGNGTGVHVDRMFYMHLFDDGRIESYEFTEDMITSQLPELMELHMDQENEEVQVYSKEGEAPVLIASCPYAEEIGDMTVESVMMSTSHIRFRAEPAMLVMGIQVNTTESAMPYFIGELSFQITPLYDGNGVTFVLSGVSSFSNDEWLQSEAE